MEGQTPGYFTRIGRLSWGTQAKRRALQSTSSRFGMVWSDPEQTAALFIGVHNEPPTVITMRVCNPDCAPFGING